jgi:myo-inositol-1(or 4)-monophosphatase
MSASSHSHGQQPSHSSDLSAIIDACRAAGAGLMRYFRDPELKVGTKGLSDFVSAADLEAEACLRSALLEALPGCSILAEESGVTAGASDGARLIIDPLDGTTNFLNGIAHFAVSVALERAGRIVAGVVFDPAKDELFAAEEGRGCWLGTQRLHVSRESDFSRAIVATGIPHASHPERHPPYLPKLAAAMHVAGGIRRLGAASLDLAYVAAGRFAVYFEYGLAPWDVAGGTILVREAGGRISEPSGGQRIVETGNVLATNGVLHEPMARLLTSA